MESIELTRISIKTSCFLSYFCSTAVWSTCASPLRRSIRLPWQKCWARTWTPSSLTLRRPAEIVFSTSRSREESPRPSCPSTTSRWIRWSADDESAREALEWLQFTVSKWQSWVKTLNVNKPERKRFMSGTKKETALVKWTKWQD